MIMGIIIGVIVLGIISLTIMGLVIVKQAETMVIERLGRFSRILPSGINIIWPFLEHARDIEWKYIKTGVNGELTIRRVIKSRIDLRETVYDFPKQNVITRDNVTIQINALLYFQIVDPKRAIYEIQNLPDAIEKLTQTTLRNVIGDLDLDHTLTSRDTINQKLGATLDEATEKWGIKVNRVELQDIIPPADVKEAMEKQMRAERNRRAQILEAEGNKQAKILEAEGMRQSEINKAEGIKQSLVLQASGEAEARITVAQAESEAVLKVTKAIQNAGGNPTAYLIALKYIDALREMTTGKDNKVIYIPYEASALLSSLGSLKNLFNATSQK
jgi:regulator of protease activity HflC (stomatin/prohibitin superfamily)